MNGTEVEVDPELGSIVYDNDSGIPSEDVMQALSMQHPLVASMIRWSANTRHQGRHGTLFERDKYVTPVKVLDKMRVAYHAVENDDVVGNIADTTESLAVPQVAFWCKDADEQDVWNQWAADVDLDARLREMWRDSFTYSTFYCGIFWGKKTYKVRGTSDKGTARKKQFKLNVPLSMTMLDPLKIAPVGMTIFNREKLVWCATRAEIDDIDNVLDGKVIDPVISTLILDKYEPSEEDRRFLGEEGYLWDQLYLLNPRNVFRYSQTRSAYHRQAAVRLASVFELLDLKDQLKQMDRAHLIGGTNFIVLIKKGTDQNPAVPEEIEGLQEQVRSVARVPVIVGDHRLNVEIITPKLDVTLDEAKYGAIDARITARLYGMFLLGGSRSTVGSAADKSGDLGKLIARGMESRRKMIKRVLEKHVFKVILDDNDALTDSAKLKFTPGQIALGFDANWASFLLDLRESNEISRETILSTFDLDQDDEAAMLKREAEQYDDIFQTQMPYAAPNPKNVGPDIGAPTGGDFPGPANPGGSNRGGAPADTTPTQPNSKTAGRRGGGNKNGGGAAPGSGQGQAPRRARRTQ